MLINLSNHSVKKWADEQHETAIKQYGEIVDLQFPKISPEASLDEVKNVVNDFVARTLALFKDRKTNASNAVHIMGEYTFFFQFAKIMEVENISCICSTTERIVKENPDGSKISEFRFIRFRPYF